MIHAEHLPGAENIYADWESHHVKDSSDWRLERDIHTARGPAGSLLNRPLCLADKCPSSRVLQLETRPCSPSSRCTLDQVAGSLPLHVPAICPRPPLPRETEARKGISSSYRPSLAQSGVVPSVPPESNRPSSVGANTGHSDRPRGLKSPHDCTGRMACLRRSWQSEGLSDEVVAIIGKSWQFSTESAYSSAWRQWDCWCAERNIDPISAPDRDILEFLLSPFE